MPLKIVFIQSETTYIEGTVTDLKGSSQSKVLEKRGDNFGSRACPEAFSPEF